MGATMTEENPKAIIVMDTGAGGLRMVTGDDKPAEITDVVTTPPTITGQHGRAWTCDLEAGRREMGISTEVDATLVHWIVEAAWAHPVWHSYSIILVHLRPMADNRPTKIYLDGATHELWVHAMDPQLDREPLILNGRVQGHFLQPSNFAAQINEASDDIAIARIAQTVQAICDGRLSPDTDRRRSWEKLFGNNMVRPEYR
jgi:hypothetical protein